MADRTTHTRSMRNTTRAVGFGLALLMLFSAIAAPVDAASAKVVATPAPDFIEMPGPQGGYLLGTDVPRTDKLQARTFTIYNSPTGTLPGGPIEQVTFQITTAAAKDATPCANAKINFNPEKTKAAGWSVLIDNTGNSAATMVTFKADAALGGVPIGLGQTKDFSIGFNVMNNPATGCIFPGLSNTPQSFVQAFYGSPLTAYDAIPIEFRVDDHAPSILRAVTRDDGGPTASQQGYRNGHIDQVIVTFDQLIDTKSLVVSDFKIESSPKYGVYEITKAEIVHNHALGSPQPSDPNQKPCKWDAATATHYQVAVTPGLYGCTQVRFYVAEKAEFDTDSQPKVTYCANGPGSLTDMAGNAMKCGTTSSIDQAAAIFVGATAYRTTGATNYNSVRLTFSEAVQHTPVVGTPKVEVGDLYYCDNPDPSNSFSKPPYNAGPTQGCNWRTLSGTPAAPDQNINTIGTSATSPPGSPHVWDITPAPTPNTPGVTDPARQGLKPKDVGKLDPDHICTYNFHSPPPVNPSTGAVMAASLVDRNNWPAMATCLPIRTIDVLEPIPLEVNIASLRATLKFNGPVAAQDNGPLTAKDFSIASTPCTPQSSGCGPTGVVLVKHQACTDQLVLEFDKRVTETDVDATPAHLSWLPNTIRACNIQPETYVPVPPGFGIPFRDATPPAIQAAHTVDSDGNGVVDGLYVEFNEDINDASFCNFDATCYNDGDATPNEMTAWGIESDIQITINVPVGVAAITGPFTFDTDLSNNDRFGVISWKEEQNTPGPLAAGTGVVPDFTWTLASGVPQSVGLFLDFASNPAANPMQPLTTSQLVETDGSPPIVIAAHTADTEAYDTQGKPCEPATDPANPTGAPIARPDCTPDPDGFIDSMRVRFSEPVLDSSFDKDQWRIQQGTTVYKVTGFNTGNRNDDTENDDIIHVVFDKGSEPDTDARPDITYTKPGATVIPRDLRLKDTPAMKDFMGIPMNTFGDAAVTEKDRAAPVITNIKAIAGVETITLTFSEPVDDGAAGSLTTADFGYSNRNSAGSPQCPGGASGFAAGSLSHVAGGKTATMTLNQCLSLLDIGSVDPEKRTLTGDAIYAAFTSIRETQPNLEPHERQWMASTHEPLSKAPDQIAPKAVDDLVVDIPRPNEVVLSWTAPGNDGAGNGKVARYQVAVSTTQITESNFKSIVDATPATYTFSPNPKPVTPGEGLAEPNTRQKMTITGLTPQTTYFFSVKAEDDSKVPNLSAFGNVVQNQTRGDVTLPEGAPNASCGPIPRSKPVPPAQAKTLQCTWFAVSDPESEVVYHYALNLVGDGYEVKQSDPSTKTLDAEVPFPGAGTYWFHIRAFSAAGPQPLTQHIGPYMIDYPSIPEADLNIANEELAVTVKVVRAAEGGNEVNWTMPDSVLSGLPAGSAVKGFTVWRLENGQWLKLADLPKDAVNYTDVDGRKSDTYLVTMRFESNQGITEPPVAARGAYAGRGVDSGDGSIPPWIWIMIAVGLALVAGGLILFFVLRGRGGAGLEQEQVAEAYMSEPAPAGTDEASGLPTHDVKCPTCSTDFQAVGNLPLQITCPNCSSTGMLN